ncbi:MAG: 50S ribosomal protein L22 [Bacteroidota bacterium]
MLEAKAIQRYLGSSPRKMRLVVDLIRGRSVDDALSILHFSPKHAARLAEKVLRSAVSNIHNTDAGARLDASDLIVKTVFVDGGPTMKRVLPAPMGRAYQIRKRSNHVTIVVAQKEKKLKQTAKQKTTAGKAAEEQTEKQTPVTTEE